MRCLPMSFVLAVALLAMVPAHAEDQSDWLTMRRAQFAVWQAAHPNVEAQIGEMKAKTAALVAAYRARAALAALPAPLDPDASAPPVILRVPGALTELWDSPDSPQMAVIPAGEYTMGTPPSEQNRQAIEGPQHRVTIGYSFVVGKFDVTRAEYAAFVSATGYKGKHDDGCHVFDGQSFSKSSRANWQRPGFDQTSNDPVVCVNWNDAQAYTAWLSRKTGHTYRLLSESEYEYAARAGTTTAYWWGDSVGTNMANCDGCGSKWDNQQTAPSGSFLANPFDLYDMNGNVWQWNADCWHDNYNGAPKEGSAWGNDHCGPRVLRGGSWFNSPRDTRTAYRHWNGSSDDRSTCFGFRVARTL